MKCSIFLIFLLPLLACAAWSDKYSALFKNITDSLDTSIKENHLQHLKIMDSADEQHEDLKDMIELLQTHIGNVTEKEVFDHVGSLMKNVQIKIKEWKSQGDAQNSEIQRKRLKQTEEIKKIVLKVLERYEPAQNCYELYQMGVNKNGVYVVRPKSMTTNVFVYCDMDDGGWTVFQRRDFYAEKKADFVNTWLNFKHGFGELRGEFWLGNEVVHQMTKNKPHEMKIDMKDFSNVTSSATFTGVTFAGVNQKYQISISGDVDRSIGSDFSFTRRYYCDFLTKDTNLGMTVCSAVGGFWYCRCGTNAHLNGRHGNNSNGGQITFDGVTPLSNSVMKIRPQN